jgi:hypothetical protein
MRDFTFSRRACALVVLAFAIQNSHSTWCRAAFLNVYGGPTYSDSTGGYLVQPNAQYIGASFYP